MTVSVDAVVYYRVSNPTMATNNIEDYSHSTRLLAATTLRNVLGTKNLAEILSERETISQVMQNALDEATDPWGVKVSNLARKPQLRSVMTPFLSFRPSAWRCKWFLPRSRFFSQFSTSSFACSKDVRLPVQLQRAMAAEAEAAREARAKVRFRSVKMTFRKWNDDAPLYYPSSLFS